MPADTPLATPEEEFIVAIPVDPLVQVPPEVVLPSVVVKPTHAAVVPVIAASDGKALTVSDWRAVLVPPHPPEIV